MNPPIKSGDDTGLGNSKIFVIASEAKQSHLLSLEFRHCEALKKEGAIFKEF